MTAAITDLGQFAHLRVRAEQDDPDVLREVAGQFEALFIQMVLKNMREAALADPIFGDSDQHTMYREILDQQLSMEMASGRGIGLGDMLVRQLGGERKAVPTTGRRAVPSSTPTAPSWTSPSEFARVLWPHAERAGQELNVAPKAILAHAALETGWGEHVMPGARGASSHNLFGIKARGDWRGDSVAKTTIEFSGGAAVRQTARFRAYPDFVATFRDYVEFLGREPRYESVRNRGDDIAGFADALQRSGYATDPNYARKLTRVAHSDTMQNALRELKSDAPAPIINGHAMDEAR